MATVTNRNATVQTFTFYVYLAEVTELTDDLENRIFAAGCGDALLASKGAQVYLNFDRQAESLDAAVASAMRDVAAAGLEVCTIEIPRPPK